MKRRLIISDIDGILREDKKPIEPVLVESLLDITKNVLLVCITGAPLHHVPEVLFDCSWMIFAEMGGVKWEKGRVEIHSQKQKYIQEIKEVLGIASDKEDGEVETYLGKVILEGPRKTSLTFLIGEPEHYQGQKGSLYFEDLQTFLKFVIDVKKLPLKISVGADKKYQWIDVISCTKKETIEKYFEKRREEFDEIYYLGDSASDFEAMKIPWLKPVAFSNCLEEIQKEAKKRGIMISLPAFSGGVIKFFEMLD